MTTINRAQAQALANNFLNSLGKSKGAFADMSIVSEMLAMGAQTFIDNATRNLEEKNAISTGELASSLTFSIRKEGKATILSVGYPVNSKGAKYYDFVNKGVAGTESNSRGATGDYRFKTPYASKKLATLILLWFRKNGSKVRTRDAQKYTLKGVETKGKSLNDTIKSANSLKSLAYATSVNIKKKGLRATHFFDDAVETTFSDAFSEALSIALCAEIRLEIKRFNADK